MKDHTPKDKTNRSHSVANDVGQSSTKTTQAYQIDDRRSASVMQRKFRNLANGLASANIIQPKTAALDLKTKARTFGTDTKDSD